MNQNFVDYLEAKLDSFGLGLLNELKHTGGHESSVTVTVVLNAGGDFQDVKSNVTIKRQSESYPQIYELSRNG